MPRTSSRPAGSDSLVALDLRIALARKRVAWLQSERSEQAMRGIRRLLQNLPDDSVGDRIIKRLDALIGVAERKLAALEAERAALLLAGIDALLGADE